MNVAWLEKEALPEAIRQRVRHVDVVLDIGTGIQPQTYVFPLVHICVEPFAPYIDRLRKDVGDDPRFVFLTGTWQTVLPTLPDKSVDSVFALDVIEHLEKKDGFELLRQARRLARRQVVIFTPLGFFPQDHDEDDPTDRWGMAGGYWQTHRSGWEPRDFDDDWSFVICEHFHEVDGNDQPLDEPAPAFWAFLDLDEEDGAADDVALRASYRRLRGMYYRRRARRLLPGWAYRTLRRLKNR